MKMTSLCRFCYMNPNEDMNDCSIPEEVMSLSLNLYSYAL